jgi:protein-S-isoprenylcysteine O-methyltransferase Ste14
MGIDIHASAGAVVGGVAASGTDLGRWTHPVLVYMYVRLAHREEREVAQEFGQPYTEYAARTPAFVPRLLTRLLRR